MGQTKRRKKKPAKTTASAPVPSATEKGTKVTVDIHIGGIEFLEGSSKLDNTNGLAGGATGPQGSLRYDLEWADRAKAVEWFKAGCDQDPSAEMWFSASLSKFQRKELHSLFTASTFPGLKAVSQGSEEHRQIGIVHVSNCKWDIPTLSDADEMKAHVLLGYLRDSGQTVSVDEVRGMIAKQSLTADLAATVDILVKTQQDLSTLLNAVTSGHAEEVQSILSASPGIVNVKQCDTGELALHTAAAAGNISIMVLLVGAGASLEERDGKGRTALEAARAAEQCNAEGWLLQQGAKDHAAQHELTEAVNLQTLDASDAVPVSNSGTGSFQTEDRSFVVTDSTAVDEVPQMHDAALSNQDALGPTTPDPEEAIKNDRSDALVIEGVHQSAASSSVTATPTPNHVNGACRDTGADASEPDTCGAMHSYARLPSVGNEDSVVVGRSQGMSQGESQANGARHDVESQDAPAPKVNLVPEIEPAPLRPPRPSDMDDYAISMEQDEENGMDVLADWASNAVAVVSDFCGRYPAVVATAGALLAVAGAVVVKLASSGRR